MNVGYLCRRMRSVLYIHGMGGGVDSRTPKALRNLRRDLDIVIRTYDFDPAVALPQIESWVEEVKPSLIIAESMGANYAFLVGAGIPHIYLSPALGAPARFGRMRWLFHLAFVRKSVAKMFPVRPGERQSLHFDYETMSHFHEFSKLVKAAVKEQALARKSGKGDMVMAFFGRRDFYRKSGIVRIRQWVRLFGKDSVHLDNESHFWEKKRVRSEMLPTLNKVLPRERKK